LPDNLFINLKLPSLGSGITIHKAQNTQNTLTFRKQIENYSHECVLYNDFLISLNSFLPNLVSFFTCVTTKTKKKHCAVKGGQDK